MQNKIIISGTNGTIGQVLVPFLQEKGYETIPWDRSIVPIDDYQKMEDFILPHQPKALIHLAAITSLNENERTNSWQVNYEWPSEIAWICRMHLLKFIFVSTSMVFSNPNLGPYTLMSVPDAQQAYGFEKRLAENRVLSQNPESVILRLGWQIAEKGINSMITKLDYQMQEYGEIKASSKWFPSCSFVEDTVDCIAQSLDFSKGVYQLNSNVNWSFYQIANALQSFYNKDWKIVQTEDFCIDQRMFDPRIQIKTLEDRLKHKDQ